MTTPIDEMTDEDLNRAICEALGWKHDVHNTSAWDHPEYGRRYDDSIICGIPNYITGPTALDNIAKAEATLTDEEYARFKNTLSAMAYNSSFGKDAIEIDRAFLSAPAKPRAIAWLKAKEAQA